MIKALELSFCAAAKRKRSCIAIKGQTGLSCITFRGLSSIPNFEIGSDGGFWGSVPNADLATETARTAEAKTSSKALGISLRIMLPNGLDHSISKYINSQPKESTNLGYNFQLDPTTFFLNNTIFIDTDHDTAYSEYVLYVVGLLPLGIFYLWF